MKLEFSNGFEDLAFVLRYFCRDASLENVDSGVRLFSGDDKHEGLDDVLSALYKMFEKNHDHKKIKETKKLRENPEVRKADVSISSLVSFYGLYSQMITQGILKNKPFIDQMVEKIAPCMKLDPDFQLLDIQVGEIVSVGDVQDLDKLYSEEVIGREKMQVLSGLREHVRKEELLGNKFLFVTNMKPAKFKGQVSEGMILCAKGKDGKIEPIKIQSEIGNGSRLELEGFETILNDFNSGKVDMRKSGYARALESFKIVDHFLTFKGVKVTCGGKYIKTNTPDGLVS
ncbi:tRNA-binding domain-containing CsaA-like protein [Encephalitozoon hellem ATCC 50504]|uniref:Methionine tRNA ligase n=1 Tax=Encephalitozoon hellem TaxID=27973 RepID=A0A9Q9FBC4_ENCHE|nr:tRNA-binding domain-containing CsaA-like protein [Encephalitozoon hellem ATCC 50504]AFM98196.1 tRNA-binding domain-containing CsaA-like protein [Encephalitozoon hellem ATCC 50504]UTX43045.1 methionine tRNA ligase [Encephalitozoon hellem]|eukprot:XP_003887177.1 tRNA-binding domain-containing CsaA-like protein [Encephalitozoon hellem ATCC 50504]